MLEYSQSNYRKQLESQGVMPKGFRSGVASLSFIPSERPTQEPYKMNISTVITNKPVSSVAGVFTQNAFPGAPVLIARQRIPGKQIQGFLVNNRIANVSSPTGIEDALQLSGSLAQHLGSQPDTILPVSTGIIGWRLPVPEMLQAQHQLMSNLQDTSLVSFSEAIMTTDSFPKIRSTPLGSGTLVGVAKGAGMIEPNLATMLVFLLTDVGFDPLEGQKVLSRVAEKTFNSISVDSDQSTSDMVTLLGSEWFPKVEPQELEKALEEVCSQLAQDIVRNGEGTSHVIQMVVQGRSTNQEARGIAKAVVNSPLVKTAIYGNDPNVGRILSSMGDYLGNMGLEGYRESLTIRIGEELVFDRGVFHLDLQKELRISQYLADTAMNPRITGYPQHDKVVAITADFHQGAGAAKVYGSDLSHEYVHENADYRS